VTQAGPLGEDAVWRLAGGLAEALQAIHAEGLVHRDLKPGNILIAADGPRVIDFGISRTTSGTVVTATQTTIGTPAYMSPEQAQGHAVGPASDIFSLGSVLAFAATGAAPFGGGEMFAVGFRVVHGDPDLTGVPASLRPVIDACLAKDPAARPVLGQLMEAVAASAAAYPDVAPGKFWPDQVAAVLESRSLTPVLPPPTSVPPASPATHSVDSGSGQQTPPSSARYTPPGSAQYSSRAAADPVVRRRGPRWLLPVVLAVAVAIAAAIALTLAFSPGPKAPSFEPGLSGTPAATATG
jgi:serine/threonine protein kinase